MAARMGVRVKALENRIDPHPHLTPEWVAFTTLSRRRPVGFSVGAIPLQEIIAYMDEIGLDDPDDREDFLQLIEAMDTEFVRVQNEKAEKKK